MNIEQVEAANKVVKELFTYVLNKELELPFPIKLTYELGILVASVEPFDLDDLVIANFDVDDVDTPLQERKEKFIESFNQFFADMSSAENPVQFVIELMAQIAADEVIYRAENFLLSMQEQLLGNVDELSTIPAINATIN